MRAELPVLNPEQNIDLHTGVPVSIDLNLSREGATASVTVTDTGSRSKRSHSSDTDISQIVLERRMGPRASRAIRRSVSSTPGCHRRQRPMHPRGSESQSNTRRWHSSDRQHVRIFAPVSMLEIATVEVLTEQFPPSLVTAWRRHKRQHPFGLEVPHRGISLSGEVFPPWKWSVDFVPHKKFGF